MGVPISIRFELKKTRGKSARLRKIHTGVHLTAVAFLVLLAAGMARLLMNHPARVRAVRRRDIISSLNSSGRLPTGARPKKQPRPR